MARAKLSDKTVVPGGPRRIERIGTIEHGHRIARRGTRLVRISADGTAVDELGEAPRVRWRRSKHLHRFFVAGAKRSAGVLSAGWLGYAWWDCPSGDSVTTCRTQWVVPNAPMSDSKQNLFFFNGLENSNYILQPVLQWGASKIGGGAYWAIGSWYAQGQFGAAQCTPLTKVNPGTALVGVITGSPSNDGGYDYTCQFEGYPSTLLPVSSHDELSTVVQTFEAYGLTQAYDLPDGGGTMAMTNIEVQTALGAGSIIDWQTSPLTGANIAADATIVNGAASGGEIDIGYW